MKDEEEGLFTGCRMLLTMNNRTEMSWQKSCLSEETGVLCKRERATLVLTSDIYEGWQLRKEVLMFQTGGTCGCGKSRKALNDGGEDCSQEADYHG